MTFDVTSINNGVNILAGTYLPVFEIGDKMDLLLGDANSDGILDEKDVDAIVKHIMGETIENFDEKAADLNNDEKINVADIVLLNKLLGENP